ncbi:MBL fold metallo-hydrolase [Bacillus sp. FJAT-42376]|uniref:MBL fold metallo-hydrolase n=1 Tax=Bacillus sp. FJAT-42376 TaxID=2014076 RepID=UPI000F4EEE5A|nr:MBL fold metallo-hydrolase [Bacillus sp. FJAT-42376]AZB41296.1 MBL fold metallo-hydrolase [Bacillus sp. FJAT-42376]
MSNVHILNISLESSGEARTIYPVLLHDQENTVLVDCGYPGCSFYLKEAARKTGVPLDSITKIIITHHDVDHMGSLAALKREYPEMKIASLEEEAPYISGTKKSLRLEQAETTYADLPEEEKAGADQFISLLKSIEPAPVDILFSAGEVLPWCGEIEVIHTPGHLPGHISLYLRREKTLIAGDALVAEGNRLEIANPQFTLDMEEALRSVERLMDYEIEKVICYHGGLYTGDVKEALRQLLELYK